MAEANTEGVPPAPEQPPRRKIRFDYIKSASFRVIHADGVVGGLTPRLDVHMDFWSERLPIPRRVVHEINQDGVLSEEIMDEREVRDAFVREVEAGVVLDLDTAKAIHKWLDEKIQQAEKARKSSETSS